MKKTQRLAAIMFTDIVGYTMMMGQDEKKTLEILRQNQELHKSRIKANNGTLLKEMGDGMMASFSTISEAVYCAGEIIRDSQSIEGLDLRIGIHQGEVHMLGKDIFGDGVNVASRIQELAEPKQILASESVYRNVRNKEGVESLHIGRHRLKNVEGEMDIYQLTIVSIPEVVAAPIKQKGRSLFMWIAAAVLVLVAGTFALKSSGAFTKTVDSIPDEKSLAVLPFKVIGDDPEGAYFSEGVQDVLISSLSNIEDLQVRSRTSAELAMGPGQSLQEVARKLNARYIVEGSTQKYQNDVRIVVQLIDPSVDDHIWEHTYDFKFEEIFDVQSEIVLQISDALQVILSDQEKSELAKTPTKSKLAWDLYLKGMFYRNQFNKFKEQSDIEIAIAFYRRALDEDPNFALAMGWLANAMVQNFDDAQVDTIRTLVEHSLIIDPQLDISYVDLGDIVFYFENNKVGALQYYEKAVECNPRNQDNHTILAWKYEEVSNQINGYRHLLDSAMLIGAYAMSLEPGTYVTHLHSLIARMYMSYGKFELGESFCEISLELEPDNLSAYNALFYTRLFQYKYDEALLTAKKSLGIRSDNIGLVDLANGYMMLERYEEAEDAFATFYALPREKHAPHNHHRHAYAHVLRKNGKEQDAQVQIALAREAIERYMSGQAYDMAKINAFTGDKETALDFLEQFVPWFGLQAWIDKDPLFENLHDEPRFHEIVRKSQTYGDSLSRVADRHIAAGAFPGLEMN